MTDLFRWNVINALLATTKQKRFLEIGIQRGVCGSKVHAGFKVGVDPAPHPSARRHYNAVHRQESDAFFAQLPAEARFDVVLVDGLHHGDQVLRDVDNALLHLAEDGAIVMHDCNPLTELAQRVPRETGVWNGDCWKAMVELRRRPGLDAFTIDSDHGIGIVRRAPNPSPLEAPGELTYPDLEEDRAKLLGLVSPVRWQERFGAPLSVGKVTLVTAIFGGRDTPLVLPELDVAEAVMFTDGAGAPGWRVERVRAEGDPRRAARRIKTLALDLVGGDVVLWVDGRIGLTGEPLQPLLRAGLAGADVAGYPHPWRACAYAEAAECARLGLADPVEVEGQTAAYRAAGFPASRGLFNTMVLARRRTAATVEMGQAWWAELQRHTLRDQISFPYVLWQEGLRCGSLGRDVYAAGSSLHFQRGRHAGEGAAA